jgi:AraC-like DNA-binding protein
MVCVSCHVYFYTSATPHTQNNCRKQWQKPNIANHLSSKTIIFTDMLQGLFIAIFFQSLVLATLCFSSVSRSKANRWLGLFFMMVAFQRLFQYILTSTSWMHEHPQYVILFEISVLTGLWAIHVFVLQVLSKGFRLAHIAYSTVAAILLIVFYAGFFAGKWNGVVSYYHENISTWLNLIVSAYAFFVIAGCLLSIRKERLQAASGNNQKRFILHAIRWLLYYWIFRSVIALLFIPVRNTMLKNLTLLARAESGYLLSVNIILIVLLSITAYFALRNPVFFEQVIDTNPTVEQQLMLAVLPESEKKMLKQEVSDEEGQQLMAHLRQIMEDKQPWLNPRLTIAKLSEIAAIPAYKITRIIKQAEGQHFNEFVNHYRVEHAKKLLSNPDHLRDTIYSIALDSGFASEAPFYAAFKKNTGESPAAWRGKLKFS